MPEAELSDAVVDRGEADRHAAILADLAEHSVDLLALRFLHQLAEPEQMKIVCPVLSLVASVMILAAEQVARHRTRTHKPLPLGSTRSRTNYGSG
ncbi:MAG: hypothetical protein ABJD68_02085 [Nakamurella sp.]